MALGLTAGDRVARLERVRLADGVPLAIERAALPRRSCPIRRRWAPRSTRCSPRAACGRCGRCSASRRPTSAARDADLLEVPVGAAGLRIERVSYLACGRVVEFTRSLYRGDAYDFAAELQLPADAEGARR